MPIQRHIKNVVHNYTDVQRKVREATSNDPWGPSSTLMAEIADKTHNVLAFTEIMQIIWRRLNDKNKNWRHVFKSLVLLDYLVKTGNENVAVQCREHIHTIETLKDFDYLENGKDHGLSVRMKAQSLSTLLRDEERLNEERTKALLARDRLIHSGFSISTPPLPSIHGSISHGSQSKLPVYSDPSQFSRRSPARSLRASTTEIESVRPQSVGEEQLQLQLALAISKEEHDREEKRRQAEEAKEEAKLLMALEQSRKEERANQENQLLVSTTNSNKIAISTLPPPSNASDGLFDLVDSLSPPAAPSTFNDPWLPIANDPFTSSTAHPVKPIPIDDPWGTQNSSAFNQPPLQPFSTSSEWANVQQPSGQSQKTSDQSPHSTANNTNGELNPVAKNGNEGDTSRRRTPADFLGEHQGLVDLDKLIERNPSSTNPFALSFRPSGGPSSVNPFLNNQHSKVPINQLAPSVGPTASNQQRPLAITGGFASPVVYGAYPSSYAPPFPMNTPGNPVIQQNPTSLNPFY